MCIDAFRELGAIDLYEIHVMPVLLGTGISLFREGGATPLRLADSRVYADGVVKLAYQLA